MIIFITLLIAVLSLLIWTLLIFFFGWFIGKDTMSDELRINHKTKWKGITYKCVNITSSNNNPKE